MTKTLEVVEIATGEVVKSVDVAGRDDWYVERVLRGMLTNLNREEFFVRESDDYIGDRKESPCTPPKPRK